MRDLICFYTKNLFIFLWSQEENVLNPKSEKLKLVVWKWKTICNIKDVFCYSFPIGHNDFINNILLIRLLTLAFLPAGTTSVCH